MALVAVVTASLYVSLFVAFRARRSATERLDMVRTARLTMDAIGRDLLATLPPNGVLIQTFTGQDNSSGGIDSDILSFSSATRASGSPDVMGDVRHVTLSLIEEPDIVTTIPAPAGTTGNVGTRVVPSNAQPGRFALVRQVQSNLLAQVQEDPVQEVLCRGVLAFNVRYYNGTAWSDSWDSSANNNSLPNAIEVTLEIAPPPPEIHAAPTTTHGYRLVRQFVPPCAPIGTSLGTTQ